MCGTGTNEHPAYCHVCDTRFTTNGKTTLPFVPIASLCSKAGGSKTGSIRRSKARGEGGGRLGTTQGARQEAR